MMIIAIAIFVIIRFIIISINVFSTEHPGKVSRVSFFWRGSISLNIRKISFPSFQLYFFTCECHRSTSTIFSARNKSLCDSGCVRREPNKAPSTRRRL